jgi:segregation and condensation protein B
LIYKCYYCKYKDGSQIQQYKKWKSKSLKIAENSNYTVNKSLSTAAMETLSIIAYKQPVTKVEIERIRGVKCSQVVKGLLDKGLIKETGRLDKPGRPVVYSTTDEFLRHFGLTSIDELPAIEDEKDDKETELQSTV